MMASQDDINKSITTNAPTLINIGSDKLILLTIVSMSLAMLSVGVAWFSYSVLRDRVIDNETETRMLEYYVQLSDAELVKNGLKKPEDTFKPKQERK